jgi:hypothetical protein
MGQERFEGAAVLIGHLGLGGHKGTQTFRHGFRAELVERPTALSPEIREGFIE